MQHHFALLLALTVPTLAGAALQDERRDLALRAAEYLDLDARETLTEAQRQRRRTLDDAIGEMVLGMLDDATEEAATELIAGVLAEHAPAALPLLEARSAARAPDATTARMAELGVALELFMAQNGRYPGADEGLVSLALGAEAVIAPYALVDGWERTFRYAPGADSTYELCSAGPDGQFGTVDDLVVDERGEPGGGPVEERITVEVAAALASTGEPLLATLPRAGKLWSLLLHAEGRGTTYVVQRDEEVFIGFGDRERGPFDSVVRLAAGDVPGAAVYRGLRDGRELLVTRDQELQLDGHMSLALVVSGTRTPHYLVTSKAGDTAWIGDRVARLDDGLPAVGEVDGTLLDFPNRLVLAYRERRADGYFLHVGGEERGPFEWVSQPIYLAGSGGKRIAYRTWDGARMAMVIGDERHECDWARDAAGQPGGDTVAFVEVEGGTPVKHFERDRHRQNKELRSGAVTSTRAVYGGTSYLVVDGERSRGYSYVEEPVFPLDPDCGNLAFRAQDAEGRWRVVHRVDGVFREYPDHESVERPVLDLDGLVAAYEASEDGSRFMCFNHEALELDGEMTLHPGPDGRIAFTIDHNGTVGFGVYDPVAPVSPIGPFASAEVSFVPGTSLVFAHVTTPEGAQALVAEGGARTPFVQWLSPPRGAASGRVAFMAGGPDSYFPMVLDVAKNELHQAPGAPYFAVAHPIVLDEGQVGFLVDDSSGFPIADDGHRPPHAFNAEVVVFDDAWSSIGPASVRGFRGRAGIFTWSFRDAENERYHVVELGAGLPVKGPPLGNAGPILQRSDGRAVYVAEGELEGTHRVIGPGGTSANYSMIDEFKLVAGTDDPTFEAYADGQWRRVVGVIEGPLFDTLMGAPDVSPDGTHLAYRGNRGGQRFENDVCFGGRNSLVLVPLADPAAFVEIEGDYVSAPRFTEDDAVQVAVLRGLEVVVVERRR